MASKYDPRKISSLSDLKLAKERYRYEILASRQALFSSSGHLRKTVRTVVNTSMQYFAQLLVAAAVKRLIFSRSRRK